MSAFSGAAVNALTLDAPNTAYPCCCNTASNSAGGVSAGGKIENVMDGNCSVLAKAFEDPGVS